MGSLFDRYLYLLVHVKGLLMGSFSRPYYSQWGEDIALKSIFADQKRGFFVDVGAYHPFHYSNTALLSRSGWRGINIDPNPASIALFKMHRPHDININAGVSETAEKRPYYIFNHQSCNTFSEAQKEMMMKKSFIRLIDTKPMPCLPLQKIIDEHAGGMSIDFLNVDVEGMSMEALRSLDFEKNAPNAICVEDDEFDFGKEGFGSEIFAHLKKRGYVIHSKVGRSVLYTRL